MISTPDSNAAASMAPPRLVLAPIRGITDAVYRAAFADCFGGFAQAVAPFIQLRQGQPLRAAELRQVAPEQNRSLPTIPQLLTNHGPSFHAALCELRDAGHAEVNWNIGCPYPMVAKRARGAGLLPHPERIAAILDQVMGAAPVRLSVKLRLGYRDPDELWPVFAVLNRYPLTEITLHPRTAAQMYGGTVDLERAGQALAQSRHPFLYNGDITTPDFFRHLRQRFPEVTAWMLGRGALANPFLPSQLHGVTLPEPELRRQRLCEFHERLLEGYRHWLSGPGHILDKMKEQWTYLALGFAQPRAVHARIRHSHDLASYKAAAAWVFEQPLAATSDSGLAQSEALS